MNPSRCFQFFTLLATLCLFSNAMAATVPVVELFQAQPKHSDIAILKQLSPSELNAAVQHYIPTPTTSAGKIIKIEHKLNDSITAPAFLYIPSHYDVKNKHPLFMYLHGGVSRPEFPSITDSDLTQDTLLKICEQNNSFYLFPLAKLGCVWWDKTGIDHLQWLINEVKRTYHIDDDRVSVGGFSDGASGSFLLSMARPTNFAQFFPWSGHMAVGALDGGHQTFLPNMRQRPIYATVGGADGLYPTHRMRPMLLAALEAGAPMTVAVFDTATHRDNYLDLQWNDFNRRIDRGYRNPFQPTLYWETTDLDFPGIDWIAITALDTARSVQPWQKDFNCTLVDDQVTIGFSSDYEWKGEGVRVAAVMKDSNSVANKIGLQKGDILTRFDTTTIHAMKDLSLARRFKKRGDEVKIEWLRNDQKLSATNRFPPPQEYAAFPREGKSSAIHAVRIGNRFNVETSCVGSFTIYLHPTMIRFDQPVEVFVNNQKVFDKIVIMDSGLMVDEFIKTHDRSLLRYAKIEITVPK